MIEHRGDVVNGVNVLILAACSEVEVKNRGKSQPILGGLLGGNNPSMKKG